MNHKYNFMTEAANWKVGVGVGGGAALLGTIYSGVKAILTRCRGNETMRKKELSRLDHEMEFIKSEIKKYTELVNKYSNKENKTEHDLDRLEYYMYQLSTAKHSLIVAQTEYNVVKNMPLKDFINTKAKKEFIEGSIKSLLGGALLGGAAYKFNKHFSLKK